MSAADIRDTISLVLLLFGAVMSLCAAIGLLRFPNVLARMHAATKPQVFGLMCVLAAVAVQFPGWSTISTLVVVLLFQMMTAPVAAHMVGRAAYRTRFIRTGMLLTDELADAVAAADARADVPDGEPNDGEPNGGNARSQDARPWSPRSQ